MELLIYLSVILFVLLALFHLITGVSNELLIIIVAVALVNILLLDAFNTSGFPTSTTISLIFSLVGAALAVVLIKQNNFDLSVHHSDFINTDRIFIILVGLLIAIVLAFVTGAVAQFFTRLIFSFLLV